MKEVQYKQVIDKKTWEQINILNENARKWVLECIIGRIPFYGEMSTVRDRNYKYVFADKNICVSFFSTGAYFACKIEGNGIGEVTYTCTKEVYYLIKDKVARLREQEKHEIDSRLWNKYLTPAEVKKESSRQKWHSRIFMS